MTMHPITEVLHQGHKITITRQLSSFDAEDGITYRISRLSDGYTCQAGFDFTRQKFCDKLRGLLEIVDHEMTQEQPWGFMS